MSFSSKQKQKEAEKNQPDRCASFVNIITIVEQASQLVLNASELFATTSKLAFGYRLLRTLTGVRLFELRERVSGLLTRLLRSEDEGDDEPWLIDRVLGRSRDLIPAQGGRSLLTGSVASLRP